jgi:hypothetical protein
LLNRGDGFMAGWTEADRRGQATPQR